jgi:hypothetical protein
MLRTLNNRPSHAPDSPDAENFRAGEQVDLDFGKRLTILLGNNGSGKTSVLDGVAIGLGAVLTYLPSVSGVTFKKSGDIRQQGNLLAPYAWGTLAMDSGVTWDRIKRRDKSQATTRATPIAKGLKALEGYLDRTVLDPLNAGQRYELPMRAKIQQLGRISDGSFSPSIVKLSVDSFVLLVEDILKDELATAKHILRKADAPDPSAKGVIKAIATKFAYRIDSDTGEEAMKQVSAYLAL